MLLNIKKCSFVSLFILLTCFSSISLAGITKTTKTITTPHKEVKSESPHKSGPLNKDDKQEVEVGSSFKMSATLLLTSIMPTVSSKVTSGSSEKSKVIIQAKNDAAVFVASNGEVRGAFLQSAFTELRKDISVDQVNDIQLAEAILAW